MPILDEWNWIIGQIVAPFGRVGEVKVRLETDFPERFERLKLVCLRTVSGSPSLIKVEKVRLHKGQALMKLEGVKSIDDAEKWRGALVQVKKSEAVSLPAGSFYVGDLMGIEVFTADGDRLGVLENVLPYPAQDLYQVGDILIPAVKEFVLEIDREAGRMVVSLPDGFLPDNSSKKPKPE